MRFYFEKLALMRDCRNDGEKATRRTGPVFPLGSERVRIRAFRKLDEGRNTLPRKSSLTPGGSDLRSTIMRGMNTAPRVMDRPALAGGGILFRLHGISLI
jgi:hypothetical protein